MTNENKKVLLVEDCPEFGENFSTYLEEDRTLEVDWVRDLVTFKEKNLTNYNLVISDLFFPYKEKSGNIELGKKLANIWKKKLKEKIDDPNIRKIYHYPRSEEGRDYPIFFETFFEKNVMKGMNLYEHNQPLGYSVLEKALKEKIPVVLNTADHFYLKEDKPTELRFGYGIYPLFVGMGAYIFGDNINRVLVSPRMNKYIDINDLDELEKKHSQEINSLGGPHIVLTRLQGKDNLNLEEIHEIYKEVEGWYKESPIKIFNCKEK